MVAFAWDEEKEKQNLEKHGVGFLTAVESFTDPNGIKLVDTK